MSNVVILHGYAETPKSFWIPYVKGELDKKGYKVFVPQLPNTDNPKLEEQLLYVLENLTLDAETILIGHSSGASLILALLETAKVKVKQSILVAGYCLPLKIQAAETKNIKPEYDWEKIKNNCDDFIFLNSDNDPWGADDAQGRYMLDKIGQGKLVIMKGEGHMGSDSYNQPYKEFPFLVTLVK